MTRWNFLQKKVNHKLDKQEFPIISHIWFHITFTQTQISVFTFEMSTLCKKINQFSRSWQHKSTSNSRTGSIQLNIIIKQLVHWYQKNTFSSSSLIALEFSKSFRWYCKMSFKLNILKFNFAIKIYLHVSSISNHRHLYFISSIIISIRIFPLLSHFIYNSRFSRRSDTIKVCHRSSHHRHSDVSVHILHHVELQRVAVAQHKYSSVLNEMTSYSTIHDTIPSS